MSIFFHRILAALHVPEPIHPRIQDEMIVFDIPVFPELPRYNTVLNEFRQRTADRNRARPESLRKLPSRVRIENDLGVIALRHEHETLHKTHGHMALRLINPRNVLVKHLYSSTSSHFRSCFYFQHSDQTTLSQHHGCRNYPSMQYAGLSQSDHG